MYGFSYWMLPVVSGLSWLGMLLGMLIGWTVGTHREHYANMKASQSVAYISDVGASPRFKPVFIALCCVTTAFLDLSFVADRWLRHRGRLTPNGSTGQKLLAVLAIGFALAGTAGLILLSVFDVAHHKRLHDGFLLLFLAGYVLAAICACCEFHRLGRHNRAVPILRASFRVKLAFILVELVLAIVYVCLTFTHSPNGGAVIEWVIAYVFTLYVLSFAVDLYPAVHTRHGLPPKSAAETVGDSEFAGPESNPVRLASLNTNTAAASAPVDSEAPAEMHDAYGQSAARATRASRSSRVQQDSYAADYAAGNGNTFEPGRAYRHRHELSGTM
ncbi:fk506 suppressor [Grosmannia clavigera kw1407]|uniref:Fk506 suppressor n=1 Tax=Grosmannia clavigera (strain kw1407 / UAMH 11150) TaxID=655863 RepID=F0XMA7_GROCL|nr:fk506 suppressor [Grosmannia clavigera kw1407]EFX01071.1 fk506 suppressor [Grosmannia clavigera kw1407]